jgi:hypothetical protein
MGWWQVSAATLAGSRFVISPLAEATASLLTLARGTAANPAERAWLAEHQPAYDALLAADPVAAALVAAGVGHRWVLLESPKSTTQLVAVTHSRAPR